jgi:hypothetical protein
MPALLFPEPGVVRKDKPQAPSSFESPPDAAASWRESKLHAVNAPLSEQPRHGHASIAHINFEDLGVLQVLKISLYLHTTEVGNLVSISRSRGTAQVC